MRLRVVELPGEKFLVVIDKVPHELFPSLNGDWDWDSSLQKLGGTALWSTVEVEL